MSRIVLGLRSVLGLAGALLWILVAGALFLYPFVLPVSLLFPARRHRLVSWFMKVVCVGIFGSLRAAGARCQRVGAVSTAGPVLVLMNHQSLLDICTATLMAVPFVPAFVTRVRYAKYVPVVSQTVRLLGCPVIDPKRDARGALGVIRQAAPALDNGVLIFAEGHRTVDGEIRPFKTAGALALLGARPMPVVLLVTDGFWNYRRLVDFVFSCGNLQGRTEVLGPFDPPQREEDLPAFLEQMRDRMIERLQGMRKQRGGVAA